MCCHKNGFNLATLWMRTIVLLRSVNVATCLDFLFDCWVIIPSWHLDHSYWFQQIEPLYVLALNMNEESHASRDIHIRVFPCVYCTPIKSKWAEEKKTLEETIHHEVDCVDALPDGSCNQAQSRGSLPNRHHLSRPDVLYFKACTQSPKNIWPFLPNMKQ